MLGIKEFLKIRRFSKEWRKSNSHNETYPNNIFDAGCVSVGNKTYGTLMVYTFNKTNQLKIGHYCSIAPNVTFVVSADHRVDTISTYPFKVYCAGQDLEGISKGDIEVGDDVWIGCNATILSGVSIGQGAVVAAGSVVTKDVPPYAIVGGAPAKVIKYRFEEEVIEKLLQIDYGKLTDEIVRENIEPLYETVTVDNIDRLIKGLKS